jgi:thiamine biosynthesis lipoprotein
LYRHFLSLLLFSSFTIISFTQENRFVFTEPKMGSPFTIILYHADSAFARQVSETAFALVDSFVNIYSDYIAGSELNQLSASAGSGRKIKVSASMMDILNQAKRAYQYSNHAFDITIGPLSELWRSSRRLKTFPAPAEVQRRKMLVGFRHVKINHRRKTVKLKKQGMRLDLGGIAQGYIAERVLDFIQHKGIRSVLVDVSGDIAAGEAPPGRASWVLGVNLPEDAVAIHDKKLRVRDIAVSTSGDIYQYLEHAGKKYSHIIDPRTGYGVTERKNVTVIAADATTADWLATACSILPVKKGKQLAKRMKAELLVAYVENGKVRLEKTEGFDRYWDLDLLD